MTNSFTLQKKNDHLAQLRLTYHEKGTIPDFYMILNKKFTLASSWSTNLLSISHNIWWLYFICFFARYRFEFILLPQLFSSEPLTLISKKNYWLQHLHSWLPFPNELLKHYLTCNNDLLRIKRHFHLFQLGWLQLGVEKRIICVKWLK